MPVPLEVAGELDEHVRRGHVDERHGLGVEHDGAGVPRARPAADSARTASAFAKKSPLSTRTIATPGTCSFSG